MSLSVLNNFELCYRGTSFKVQGGDSVIAAFFLARNYVSEQFGNYVEYGSEEHNILLSKRYNFNMVASMGKLKPSYLPHLVGIHHCAVAIHYTEAILVIAYILPTSFISLIRKTAEEIQTEIALVSARIHDNQSEDRRNG